MPISIQASAGLLTIEAEKQLFAGVMDSFLRINGAKGNSFITPNLIGDGVTIPAGRSFAGGVADDFVAVGLKVPSFSLPTQEQRQAFVTEVTDLVERLAEGRLPRSRVLVNMVFGSGMWGIGGLAYTDEMLIAAIEAAA